MFLQLAEKSIRSLPAHLRTINYFIYETHTINIKHNNHPGKAQCA